LAKYFSVFTVKYVRSVVLIFNIILLCFKQAVTLILSTGFRRKKGGL